MHEMEEAVKHGITEEEYARLISSLNELGKHLMKFELIFTGVQITTEKKPYCEPIKKSE